MIDDNKYPLYLSMSKFALNGFVEAEKKISVDANKLAQEIFQMQNEISQVEDVKKFQEVAKNIDKKKSELFDVLKVKTKLKNLISQNEKRVNYLSEKCASLGLAETNFSEKELNQLKNEENSLSIFLNENEVQPKLFKGRLFFVQNGKLSFGVENNFETAKSLSDEEFSDLISIFPEAVSTFDITMLLDSTFKKKLLKAIATYVYDNISKKGMYEINSDLGSLLSFKEAIPDGVECFTLSVKNLFDVKICEYLLKNYPNQNNEILNKIKCNPNSELIPKEMVDLSLFERKEEEKKDETSSDGDVSDDEIDDIINSILGDM